MAGEGPPRVTNGDGEEALSKNEIKRRMKAERLAAAKEAKQAAKRTEAPAATAPDEDDEEHMTSQQYFAHRLRAIEVYRQQGHDPYPHKFAVSTTIPTFVSQYAGVESGARLEQHVESLAGRVRSRRLSGARLFFYDLVGDGVKVQVVADARLDTTGRFADTHAMLRRGDIAGVRGHPGRTKKGELSLFATETVLLSSCLHMLPKAHQVLSDPETRFRQRYLDLIMNASVRATFELRADVIRFIRRFLDERGFLEVETPMMNTVAGGATAKPFVTHHNELGIQMFMRIAPELYLKQLVIGGLERVYELGRNFRNEGIDLTHNPEFTACEFYAAYLDYNDLMQLTEEMLSSMVKQLTGGYVVRYHPDGSQDEARTVEIDFTPPFRRLSMLEALRQALDAEAQALLPAAGELGSDAAQRQLQQLCTRLGVVCHPPLTTARLLDKLVGELVEPHCISPTFLCDHPEVSSPLAKWHRACPGLTERFELFVNGKELCNAYTELNDPLVQRERFTRSQRDADTGDEEAMVADEDFCTALEYGLPPTAGWGIGIDRLVMLLADHNNIKEVLLFPAMKPRAVVTAASGVEDMATVLQSGCAVAEVAAPRPPARTAPAGACTPGASQ